MNEQQEATICGNGLWERLSWTTAIATILLLWIPNIQAGSATWATDPDSGTWNDAANWAPMIVPNGSADIATFAVSTQTSVMIDSFVEVAGVVFNAGANAYFITTSGIDPFTDAELTISGAGIVNNSGKLQIFSSGFGASGIIRFTNSATAGSSTMFTNLPGYTLGLQHALGLTSFHDNATAGNGSFVNNGSNSTDSGNGFFFGGSTEFHDSSTAGNGTITSNGGTVSGARGGQTDFFDTSSAANSSLIANGGTGGGLGGEISFLANSLGGTARVKVFGNGRLRIDQHNTPGVTIGSLAGNGKVFLGAYNLIVGSNNLSTTFSGLIEDSPEYGSLSKIGTGTLTLSSRNTYRGPTFVSGGTLQVTHDGAIGQGIGYLIINAPDATLRLQGGLINNYIANLSTLDMDYRATVDLNFTGPADLIYSLIVGGLAYPPGIYGSAASGAPHQLPQLTGPGTLQVGLPPNVDFSNDGNSDIVFQNNLTGERRVWWMNGTTFVTSRTIANVSTYWNIAGVGDFNHDGRSDILWQNTLTGECLIWFMNGSGFNGKASLGIVSKSWRIAGVGDFNGDASSDIIWQHSSGACAIWLMDGTILRSTVSLGTVSTSWKIVGAGNFNADGTSDILWQHTSGARSIWLMTGTVHSGSASLGIVSTSWNIAGRGDFNGDGQSDILWEHTSGARAIWLMNGTVRSSVVGLGTVPTEWAIKNY
jgi:autotransporter-associated beta strand protein